MLDREDVLPIVLMAIGFLCIFGNFIVETQSRSMNIALIVVGFLFLLTGFHIGTRTIAPR